MEDEERGPVTWGGEKVEEALVLERRVWNQEKGIRIIRVFLTIDAKLENA